MVTISNTPNPNALKFTVGVDVGGPQTWAAGMVSDDPLTASLLGLPGVSSIFQSADFVTLTKTPDADWAEIAPEAQRILEEHFGV
ncbi:MAG: NifU N-terminal domain-containing protein [Acidimicrobiia bacterium]